jgi:hypothetical protein
MARRIGSVCTTVTKPSLVSARTLEIEDLLQLVVGPDEPDVEHRGDDTFRREALQLRETPGSCGGCGEES